MSAKKQVTKDMILSAAFNMMRCGGIEAINVKALAKELNCSTQPIYLSFSSMDDLRSELSAKAIQYFLFKLKSESSDLQFNLYSMSYINFANNEKKIFQFLFMRRNSFAELKESLSLIINESIISIMKKYSINYDEAHRLHDQLWMHAHGIASMIATDFCDWNMKKAEDMLMEFQICLREKYNK
jgi:AcrR family transcriptional regulator